MEKHLSIVRVLAFTCCLLSYFAESRKQLNKENVIQLAGALPSNTVDPSRVTELSWRPRVFLYNGFLSDEECEHLISLGNDKKDKSSSNNSANAVEFSLESQDEITARIEEKISAWTFLPKGNGKPLHVFYSGLEETRENNNYLGNKSLLLRGESLMATVVIYLSNVTQGGQILFPGAESRSSGLKNNIWPDCSQITKPIKGNAILFFSLHPNASLDPSSSHARCPITEGDMWWATKVFVVKMKYVTRLASGTGDDDLCTDEDDNCPKWAEIGECERNPVYMIGTADYYGTCRKSCNVC